MGIGDVAWDGAWTLGVVVARTLGVDCFGLEGTWTLAAVLACCSGTLGVPGTSAAGDCCPWLATSAVNGCRWALGGVCDTVAGEGGSATSSR